MKIQLLNKIAKIGLDELDSSYTVGEDVTGADGIMVEVHNNPSCALCDGAQSLTPVQFAELNKKVNKVREAIR